MIPHPLSSAQIPAQIKLRSQMIPHPRSSDLRSDLRLGLRLDQPGPAWTRVGQIRPTSGHPVDPSGHPSGHLSGHLALLWGSTVDTFSFDKGEETALSFSIKKRKVSTVDPHKRARCPLGCPLRCPLGVHWVSTGGARV